MSSTSSTDETRTVETVTPEIGIVRGADQTGHVTGHRGEQEPRAEHDEAMISEIYTCWTIVLVDQEQGDDGADDHHDDPLHRQVPLQPLGVRFAFLDLLVGLAARWSCR